MANRIFSIATAVGQPSRFARFAVGKFGPLVDLLCPLLDFFVELLLQVRICSRQKIVLQLQLPYILLQLLYLFLQILHLPQQRFQFAIVEVVKLVNFQLQNLLLQILVLLNQRL